MSAQFEYMAVLGYKEYFKKPPPEDPLHFLRSYPTDLILIMLSKINAILYQENDVYKQTAFILSEVIFLNVPEATNEMLETITKAQSKHQSLFSAASNSLLIKTLLENFIDIVPDLSVSLLKLGQDLFKTILIFNTLYYSRISGNDLQSFKGIFILELLQQTFIRSNLHFKIITMMKFAFISKFLESHTHLKEEGLEYCRNFELGNPWLLGDLFLSILTLPATKETIGEHILDTTGIPSKLIADFTFDKASLIAKSEVSLTMDVMPKPFYLFQDEHPMILDFSYLQFAIDQGFFYSLFRNTSLKSSGKFKDYNVFKGYIGLHYFEQYLVKQYLEAIFHRKNQRVISTTKYQDFIVKPSSNTVIIFEVKMADLNAKTIEDLDFERFKTFIETSFLATKLTGGKNKGVQQIIKQMENLLAAQSDLRNQLGVGRASKLSVYPVIIYSDSNLDISGVNEYINSKFEIELAELRKDFAAVKPVLMMNVNTLLEYFYLLKTNPKIMAGWIDDYFKSIKNLKRKYMDDKGPHKYILFNKSFTNYMKVKISEDQSDNNLSEMERTFNLDIIDYGKTNSIEI